MHVGPARGRRVPAGGEEKASMRVKLGLMSSVLTWTEVFHVQPEEPPAPPWLSPSATSDTSDWPEEKRRGLELFGVLDFEKFPPAHSHGSLPSTTTSTPTRPLPRRATHHVDPIHRPNPAAHPSPFPTTFFLPAIIRASASKSRLSGLASTPSEARAKQIDRRPPCLPGRAATAMTPTCP